MSAFPVTNYVLIKIHAQAVADAAHLGYWLHCQASTNATYHRDDLLAEFDKLESQIKELRASLVEAAPVSESDSTYGDWTIYSSRPPVPGVNFEFAHKDYDGAEDAGDNRCGFASTIEDARLQIDALEQEAAA